VIVSSPLRSWLFVPALRAEAWLPKALASGADAVIVDLEAAVLDSEHERARAIVRGLEWDAGAGVPVFVRLGGLGTGDFPSADAEAAVEIGAAGVVVPRVGGPDDVRMIASILDRAEAGEARTPLRIVPLLETARGIVTAPGIAAAHDRVLAVGLGGEDLTLDLGATRTADGGELAVARALTVLAAAAAGRGAIDTPWLNLSDPDGAGREAERVRRLGFAGKFVIHPAQVGPVNAGFGVTADEIDRARAVVRAFDVAVERGEAISVLDGAVIEGPIAERARALLRRAGGADAAE
jgi:citrate lyase subunit beta / citryl-CoA lyase